MLRFWHVSLLVIIALIWKVRPTSANMDVCDLHSTNISMFCTCDQMYKNVEITCFVYGLISPTNQVWGAFRKHEHAVALTLRSRLPFQMNYVPTRALQSLPSVETLTIQEANLGVLETGAISNMPKLFDLRIDRNEITSMERYAVSNLPKLNKLTLSENLLTEILADSLSGLDELELLFLDTNNISRIEACAFCNLHNLKELEIWRNHITDLTEHTFRGMRYLSRLDLYNNKIQVLNENVFQSMPKLKELNLKNNMIHYISPRAFDGLKHLALLHLSNNQLKILPDNVFQNLPKLMSLDISYNQLETLRSELMDNFHNARNAYFTFVFRDNPLKCSCEFSWVSNFIKKSSSQMFVKELRQMKCTTIDGDTTEVQEIRFKDCAKHAKKTTVQPTLPTLNSKESTKVQHPKDDSGQTDRKNLVTENAEPVTAEPNPGQSPGSGCIVRQNAVLLAYAFVLHIAWNY